MDDYIALNESASRYDSNCGAHDSSLGIGPVAIYLKQLRLPTLKRLGKIARYQVE